MFTVRVSCDGELLSEDTFDSLVPEIEFSETLKFVQNHYPDHQGISVDLFNDEGTVSASHFFA